MAAASGRLVASYGGKAGTGGWRGCNLGLGRAGDGGSRSYMPAGSLARGHLNTYNYHL
jgi:hypothetical protein